MNALDSALVKLAAASTALEHHAPTLQDVEDAKDSAKAAGKILDAAFVLMSCGIYSVAEAPSKFDDPNIYSLALPVVATEIVADEAPALVPFPGILAEWDAWDEAEQLDEYERRLEDLRVSLPDASELDLNPWDAAWTIDPKDAFTRLLVAEAREPRTFNLPDDAELAAWRAQFAPVVPEYLAAWRAAEPDEQVRQFEALLQLVEDEGIADGRKRKDWKKVALPPWQNLFTEDREAAWTKLWNVYHGRKGGAIEWDIPADEPAAEQDPEVEGAPLDVDPFEQEGGAE